MVLADNSADATKPCVVPGTHDVGNDYAATWVGRMHHLAVTHVQTNVVCTSTEVEHQVSGLSLAQWNPAGGGVLGAAVVRK